MVAIFNSRCLTEQKSNLGIDWRNECHTNIKLHFGISQQPSMLKWKNLTELEHVICQLNTNPIKVSIRTAVTSYSVQ